MYNRRYTPEKITHLERNEIFVFGSNLAGAHGGGAARIAYQNFGAVWGQGEGLQGQSYAIPTMQGGVETIAPYVDNFIEYAFTHYEYTFLVTRIGCGIAGFTVEEIAPLFKEAIELENVILPKDFVRAIENHEQNAPTPAGTPSWRAEEDFLAIYRPLMQEVNEGNTDSYYIVKELRAKEYKNTIDIVNDGKYTTEDGTTVTIDGDEEISKGSKFYTAPFSVNDIPARTSATTIEVVNGDSIEEGIRLLDAGYNPAILNMASRQNPGGGVACGAGAQEEQLFRRTNLFRSLYRYVPYGTIYGVPAATDRYPMDRNYGGIYTPGATIFRENEKKGYKLMATPRKAAFIAVAAINSPKLDRDGMIAEHLIEPTKNKIRTILRIGLQNGHDSLVLGALGCGAYHNPPRHVARLFREVFQEPEFKDKYRHIVFAILEDHNSRRNNSEGNYRPFKEELETFIKTTTMDTTTNRQTIIADSIRGSLMAGAAGDALGYPVEFISRANILNHYGSEGITKFDLRSGGKALISDDTQMTLFTACGILNALTKGVDSPEWIVRHIEKAYTDWYFTQIKIQGNNIIPRATWLRDLPQMAQCRAPGNTCMSACMSLLAGEEAWNNSKGCGGIMRVAPIAKFAHGKYTIEEIATLGGEAARSTHKHPHGFLPAALLTTLINKVLPLTLQEVQSRKESIAAETIAILDKIYKGRYEKEKHELKKLSENAIRLAAGNLPDSEAIEILGEGWVAEETWAIALYCTMRHTDSVERAIIASVNHSGDSDSTGAVTGNIMGAIHGYERIKTDNLLCPAGNTLEETLELTEITLALAEDLITGNPIADDEAIDTPRKEQWDRRYNKKEAAL